MPGSNSLQQRFDSVLSACTVFSTAPLRTKHSKRALCGREWGIKVLDWHTQHSTQADANGLISKLKRLMPIVGCEADAVAFEEEERRSLVTLPDAPGEAKTVHDVCKCQTIAVHTRKHTSISTEASIKHQHEPQHAVTPDKVTLHLRTVCGCRKSGCLTGLCTMQCISRSVCILR